MKSPFFLSFAVVLFSFTLLSFAEETKKENDGGDWKPLIGGETYDGWSNPGTAADGEVKVKDGELTLGLGIAMTGLKYDKEFPKTNFEIQYEAQRTKGYDFFGALTFPVKDSYCTFINGGWGGGVVGLSCLNGHDASENSTTQYYSFKSKKWYQFRIVVTDEKILVWITEEGKVAELKINYTITEEKISTRLETRPYQPLGIGTWCTEGVIKNFRYRELKPADIEKIKQETKKSS